MVTTMCIGKARLGTAEAVKVLLSGLKLNQAGRAAPLRVVIRIATALSAAAAANWAGKEKLKLLPAVAISVKHTDLTREFGISKATFYRYIAP